MAIRIAREIDAVLAGLNLPAASHTIRGSGHGCAEFVCQDGLTRKVYYSITTHGGRGFNNVRATVRRFARGVGSPAATRGL